MIRQESSKLASLIGAILLEKDIANLERIARQQSAGPLATVPADALPACLSDSKMRNRYFPDALSSLLGTEEWHPEIWPTYFDYAFSVAAAHNSCWQEWLHWEFGLKNAGRHMPVRSKLECSWDGREIAAIDEPEAARLMEKYTKASDPLAAELLLAQARWRKISELCLPYSFHTDEVVVYALKLLLLEKWWIISQHREDIFKKIFD